MAVPDYQSLMLPLLALTAERCCEVSNSDVIESLAKSLKLSDEELGELLPSGTQFTFSNRVAWAATYLKKACLLNPTRRGYYEITARGKDLLLTKPSKVDVRMLRQFPEFIEFQNRKGTRKLNTTADVAQLQDVPISTPSEILEEAYQNLRDELSDELLEKLKQVSPTYFERVVVELLVKMGYGGSLNDAGRAIGRSGDGGIDGIIKEDKLGLDIIYIQAKRWGTNSVGRPDIQQFAGALQGQRANKGIFITTSRFTEEAKNFVTQIGCKIILIDGEQLSQLMIDHDVGVTTAVSYQVKRIDSDFFNEGA